MIAPGVCAGGPCRGPRIVLLFAAAVSLPGLPVLGFGNQAPPEASPTTPARREPAKPADESTAFRLVDTFDGRLHLDWEVVRADPTHVSLAKNPGRLTITSQCGGLYGDEMKSGPGVPTRNLHLVRNPAVEGGDFVATTCLESFRPSVPYQQAGLLVYDGDDDYLKFIIGFNGYRGTLPVVGPGWEIQSEYTAQEFYPEGLNCDRLWFRITKCGRYYEAAYSTDGKAYTVAGAAAWGDGSPERIGVGAWNGNVAPNQASPVHRFEAVPLDAAFDLFEVRSLSEEEKDGPVYRERRKLQGTWEVVSSRLAGERLDASPLSRFMFHGVEATFLEQGQSVAARYTLSLDRRPHGLALAREGSSALLNAVYQLDDDALAICIDLSPGAPAPAELETKEGDGRLLVSLRRMSEVETAAITRRAQPRGKHFKILDGDGDGLLTPAEFLVDYPTPDAARQGTELLELLDAHRDDKLSLAEFSNRPREASFLEWDLNADGRLSAGEFSSGEMSSAPRGRAQRVFEATDRDDDGFLSLEEFFGRSAESWFVKLDTDDNERLAYGEYAAANRALVQNNRCRRMFAALDRNGDGAVSLGEFDNKSKEALFTKQDASADRKLTLDEYRAWRRGPEQKAAAQEEFAQRDTDEDGLLTFKEYAYRPDDSEFWKADTDGDFRVNLNEFKASRPQQPAEKAVAAFASIDENRDGQISLAEFKAQAKPDRPDA